jgi:hypothetical protein
MFCIWPNELKKIKDPEKTMQIWRMALCDFNDATILRAGEEAIRFGASYMPKPGQFRKLCEKVKKLVVATVDNSPKKDPEPPEWYTLNLDLVDVVKKIHYPTKKWSDVINSKFEPVENSVARPFFGMVCYEVGEIANAYKRDAECIDKIDVVGIKRAIQIANADLARAEHARTLQ